MESLYLLSDYLPSDMRFVDFDNERLGAYVRIQGFLWANAQYKIPKVSLDKIARASGLDGSLLETVLDLAVSVELIKEESTQFVFTHIQKCIKDLANRRKSFREASKKRRAKLLELKGSVNVDAMLTSTCSPHSVPLNINSHINSHINSNIDLNKEDKINTKAQPDPIETLKDLAEHKPQSFKIKKSKPTFDPTGKIKFKDWVYLKEGDQERLEKRMYNLGVDKSWFPRLVEILDAWFEQNPHMRQARTDDYKALIGWPMNELMKQYKAHQELGVANSKFNFYDNKKASNEH